MYESVKPVDGGGGLLWSALGPKTMELVHNNMDVGDAVEDIDSIITMDAELIDQFIQNNDVKKVTKKVEIDFVARIRKYSDDPKFAELGEKLEEL